MTKGEDNKVVITEVSADSVPANAIVANRPAPLADSNDLEETATEAPQPKPHSKSFGGFGLQDLAMKGVTGKLGFAKQAFKKIAFIRVRKTDATIGVTLFNKRYDTDMLLELRMEKKDEHWQLVEVSNFASFVYLIIAHEQARRDRMG